MSRGLDHDILVISGGVSAGVFDLVPGVLAELGVRQVFHKINLKPGKPLWFGVQVGRREAGGGRSESEELATGADRAPHNLPTTPSSLPAPTSSLPTPASLVFGLPGNPVSSYVCFELFVRPAIARLAGRDDVAPHQVHASLVRDFKHRSGRLTYHPARLTEARGQMAIEPLTWKGSGDLRTLVDANALAIFPAGEHWYQAGDEISALRLS
jgi:molybdopterin molybdotransferase